MAYFIVPANMDVEAAIDAEYYLVTGGHEDGKQLLSDPEFRGIEVFTCRCAENPQRCTSRDNVYCSRCSTFSWVIDPAYPPILTIPPDRLTVRFYAYQYEIDYWKEREQRNMATLYTRVPWAEVDRYPLHFAHVALTRPGQIAYTESVEKGVRDIQNTIRTGRYLERFYPDVDKATRDRWCAEVNAIDTGLKFTTDPDTIEAVYTNNCAPGQQGSPTSCMSWHADQYKSPEHPVRVYGGSPDLALAYVETTAPGADRLRIVARAIVWPARKVYGRLYGHIDLLDTLLRGQGYQSGSLKGARVRRIRHEDGYIMPYVDGIDQASLSGQWIVLDDKGPIHTQFTNGLTYEKETCDTCDSDPDYCECFTCENCQTRYDVDHYGGDGLCTDCSACCDRCNNTILRDDMNHLEGTDEYVCNACHDGMRRSCVACENDFVYEETFTRRQIREIRNAGIMWGLCPECIETHWICPACNAAVERAPHDNGDPQTCCGNRLRGEQVETLPLGPDTITLAEAERSAANV